MKIIGAIPARWGSTRFEGKVLADINGRPMIQHVWQRAKQSRLLEDVFIICDDERIFDAAQIFGARVVMSSPEHPSGTERIAHAMRHSAADIIVNIQGDEPLIQPQVIDALAQALVHDAAAVMATVIKVIKHEDDVHNPNVVKVVIDQQQNALYFSRSPIPYNRDKKTFNNLTYYKHLGLYAYRRDFLCRFKDLPLSQLEQTEKLEQLRVLESGYKIKTILTDYETIGVDVPEDLNRVLELMNKETSYG